VNAFLQAKRPKSYLTVTPDLKRYGCPSPYWRFDFKDHQHEALANVSRTVKHRAIVGYTAPAFGSRDELFSHIDKMTLAQHCTFARLDRLEGHQSWIYWEPGGTGCAC